MSEAIATKNGPYALELEAGDYWYCTCGRSASQPFCDGSHGGTSFVPRKITLAEPGKVWLCGCRRSQTPPYCDGTHKK